MPLYFYVILIGLSQNGSLEISGKYELNVESTSPKAAHLFLNINFYIQISCHRFIYHTQNGDTNSFVFNYNSQR